MQDIRNFVLKNVWYSQIIVEHRQRVFAVDQKCVAVTGVVEVVNDGPDECCHRVVILDVLL